MGNDAGEKGVCLRGTPILENNLALKGDTEAMWTGNYALGTQCRELWNTPPDHAQGHTEAELLTAGKKRVVAMLHRSVSSEKIFNITTNTDSSELRRLWVNVAGP